MQIVIDIPDHLYNVIKNKECTNKNVLTKAVENGKPLDKIRAEIEEVYNDRPRSYNHTQRRELFCKVIEIIDKYKAESEE